MKEKNFQTDFGNWIKNHLDRFPDSCAFELKIWRCDKNKSFPIKEVKTHQVEGLVAASGDGLYHKISDSPIFKGMKSRFTAKKPFDCLLLKNAKSFVVIWPYFKGQTKRQRACYPISLNNWLKLVLECSKLGKKSFGIALLNKYCIPLNIWE